ncbi:MAG: terminase small subunit [Methylococcus sp.]|nr:terminase small subunit [Methylococcus sp.]
MAELNARQKAFAEAYSQCGCAAQAARAAGYSRRTADRQGHVLLKNTEVARYLTDLSTAGQSARIADAQARQEFWTGVMLDPTAKMLDRLKASELLGRCQGDFIERLKLTGNADAPLAINVKFVGPE